MKKSLMFGFVAALGLSLAACETYGPRESSGTMIGAGAGAILGGLVGNSIGRSQDRRAYSDRRYNKKKYRRDDRRYYERHNDRGYRTQRYVHPVPPPPRRYYR